MTLQNGCVTGSTVYLWTDTAWWNGETGEEIGFDSKAFYLRNMAAAGVLSCHGGNPHEIAFEVGRAAPGNVAELLSTTADALRAYCLRGGFGRVLLATNLDGPALYMIASDRIWPDREPFEPVGLHFYTSSGNQSAAFQLAAAAGFTPQRMERVIEAQIAETFDGTGPLANLGKRRWIGGEVIEVSIAPAGVESRVVRSVEAQAA